MDKVFWQAIKTNKYAIPMGYSVDELSSELFTYIGNTDPELRDDIGYMIYAHWLSMGMFHQDVITDHISILTANLEMGIHEPGTDSVFLRSFSILFLAEIIHHDNKDPKFEKKLVDRLLGKALWYLEHELDSRGYIQGKGWAHALAHTADFLLELAKNQHIDAAQHLQILNGIQKKLVNSSDWVYVHGEDDRLSGAVIAIFQQNVLKTEDIQEWLSSFIGDWKGAWENEDRTRVFFNIRNFLRSLYIQVKIDKELSNQVVLENLILENIQKLKPY